MKIIKQSDHKHWVIGRHVKCERCDTVFEIENKDDFYTCSYTETAVKVYCPHCHCGQDVKKTSVSQTFSDPLDFDRFWNDVDKSFKRVWKSSTTT